MEKTLALIKPDAVNRNITGKIISKIEEHGFRIVAIKMLRFTKQQAEGFYAIHREKPFFSSLCSSMSSGPCIALVLEKEHAVEAWRRLMGATNPAQAEPGTIRKEFAVDLEQNSVHGSDALETANTEIKCCFSELEFTT